MAEYPVYTKAALLTEARTLLNEPVEHKWLDTELNGWIDRGARKLSQITLCVPDKDTITTAASVYCYALTIPFIKVQSVMYNNVGLQRIHSLNFGHPNAPAASNTAPKQYYHFGKHLYLWPSPAVSLTVYVYGVRSAIAYSDATDNSPTKYELPNAVQPYVLDYVLACAYAKNGKHSLAGYHFSQFLNNCNAYRSDITDRKLIIDSRDKMGVPDRTQIQQ